VLRNILVHTFEIQALNYQAPGSSEGESTPQAMVVVVVADEAGEAGEANEANAV
jgi:hypothetical protein